MTNRNERSYSEKPNSSDSIYRQDALEALRTCYETERIDYTNGNEYINYEQAVHEVEQLPSAQPKERTEERTETHACDSISRQAAIDEIDEWIKAFWENGHKESAADACLIQDGIIQLPSAQPERKKGKWIGYNADNPKWLRDDGSPVFLKCSACNTIVMNNGSAYWNFCPNCGADMRGEQDGQ